MQLNNVKVFPVSIKTKNHFKSLKKKTSLCIAHILKKHVELNKFRRFFVFYL